MRFYRSVVQLTMFQFRGMMRNRLALFFNLIIPIAFLALFGSMFGGTQVESRPKVGLIDLDQGRAATAIIAALAQPYDLVRGDEPNLREQLGNDRIKGVVIIPAGLSADQSTAAATVRVIQNPTSQASSFAVGGIARLIGSLEMVPRTAPPPFVAKVEQSAAQEFTMFDFMMPGELVYMLLNAGVVSVAIALANQRRDGSMRHLFSTPLSVGAWMVSRVMANLVLAVVQIVIVFAAGRLLFNVAPPTDLLGTGVVLCLSAAASLGIGLLIGCLTPTPESAMGGSIIISMALTFLGNAMMPLDGAPPVVQAISKLFPSTYMTQSLRMVMMQSRGLSAVTGEIAILATCAVITIGIATWRLRRQFTATT